MTGEDRPLQCHTTNYTWNNLIQVKCHNKLITVYSINKKGGLSTPTIQVGLEPTTDCLEGSCSIQLATEPCGGSYHTLTLNHQGGYRSRCVRPLYYTGVRSCVKPEVFGTTLEVLRSTDRIELSGGLTILDFRSYIS